MLTAIADTHAAIWYLFSDPRLGHGASDCIDEAIANGNHIGISAITLAEIVYLLEKGRIPAGALNGLFAAIADPESVLREVALDAAIVRKMMELRRDEIPDLPDRIIAASAKFHGVPVLSRDERIQSCGIQTVW
jgi:PIN domain nuclease of toxin-antitoxin system